MRNHTDTALKSARRLRREMSLPEVLLWQRLRGGPSGVRFRRQHPIGTFVADFYCDRAKLVVEIDGISHAMGNRPSQDERRDRWLRGCGLEVMRIPAAEVLKDPDGIAASIVALCNPPPSGASHLPPPPLGEDLA